MIKWSQIQKKFTVLDIEVFSLKKLGKKNPVIIPRLLAGGTGTAGTNNSRCRYGFNTKLKFS